MQIEKRKMEMNKKILQTPKSPENKQLCYLELTA